MDKCDEASESYLKIKTKLNLTQNLPCEPKYIAILRPNIQGYNVIDTHDKHYILFHILMAKLMNKIKCSYHKYFTLQNLKF